MGDDRPFVCTALGCGQRFTNEDHLAVHKHKHEMTLKFGQARTDTVIIAEDDICFVMPGADPCWTLRKYINFALWITGSAFTVDEA